jgi:hypothetical protein
MVEEFKGGWNCFIAGRLGAVLVPQDWRIVLGDLQPVLQFRLVTSGHQGPYQASGFGLGIVS